MAVRRTGPIVVTGATGKQGGATARHLLRQGWSVRALVRDPQSAAAQALRRAGAELVRGDFEDRASLDRVMEGAYGVFSVQPFGYETEIRQGTQVADAAAAARVKHFVYASVGGVEEQIHWRPGFSKWVIERHIAELGLPATMLRPAGFMDDLVGPFYGVPQGQFAVPFTPDALVQVIATDDIGAIAAQAFAEPEVFIGQRIELASAALTSPQIAEALSRVAGYPIPYVQIPIDEVRKQSEDVARVCEWLNAGTYRVDLDAVWRLRPNMLSFETWLVRDAAPQLARLRASS